MSRARLLLVDDHILFREGMSRLLEDEPDLELVAQVSTVNEALNSLAAGVDMILLDYDLGEQTGFVLLAAARKAGFAGRVLMLTAGMTGMQVRQALALGVGGILLKHSPPAELLASVHRVMEGELWLDAGLPTTGPAETEPRADTTLLQLTDRERSVLSGVFQGLANKEIAVKLGISEGSVKAALQQLFAKARVRSRAQLVRIALEHLEHYQLES